LGTPSTATVSIKGVSTLGLISTTTVTGTNAADNPIDPHSAYHVELTTTVTGTGPVPTGTVTIFWKEGGIYKPGLPLDAAGKISSAVYSTNCVNNTYVATYNGDANYAPSSTAEFSIVGDCPPADPGNSGSGCLFTRAYGSGSDPNVRSLREFRDRHLMTNAPGRAFVRLYYQYSPPIAAFIGEREPLRLFVQWVLTPVIIMIEHPLSALLCLLAFAIMMLMIKSRKKATLELVGLNNVQAHSNDSIMRPFLMWKMQKQKETL
jgi:hypothetical protein